MVRLWTSREQLTERDAGTHDHNSLRTLLDCIKLSSVVSATVVGYQYPPSLSHAQPRFENPRGRAGVRICEIATKSRKCFIRQIRHLGLPRPDHEISSSNLIGLLQTLPAKTQGGSSNSSPPLTGVQPVHKHIIENRRLERNCLQSRVRYLISFICRLRSRNPTTIRRPTPSDTVHTVSTWPT